MDTTTLIILGLVVVLVVAAVVVAVTRRSDLDSTTPIATERRPFSLGSAIRNAFSGKVDQGSWESLEEILLSADVGVELTDELIDRTRKHSPDSAEEALDALQTELLSEFAGKDRSMHLTGEPAVVLVVGVNGSGKTTSIAKLAKHQIDGGKKVILGAGDTFRAAAGEQLQTWGERLGARVVVGSEGGDPASVAYDTLEAGRAGSYDVAIIDTAGRLQAKKNLMAELAKIYRVAGGDEISEVLIVLDASAGQNGLAQVEAFADVVNLTGIVLTKLDGTARGGIVVAVERRLGVPVKYVGLGEGVDDLVEFQPAQFVSDLLEA